MKGVLKTQKTDPGDVTDQRGESHECAEFVIPKGIEDVSGNREPDVPCLPRLEPPEHEVSHGQENEKKHAAVEEHGSFRAHQRGRNRNLAGVRLATGEYRDIGVERTLRW